MSASRFLSTLGLAAATTALTVTTAPAVAQDAAQLNRVEVAGQNLAGPLRYDVHAACASIEGDLQRPLQKALARERVASEVNVSFVLTGSTVSEIRLQGGALGYRQDIRHAVRQLQCADPKASATPQVFTFQIAFVDEARGQALAAADQPYRIALLKR